jgi:hypothetical protein
MQQKNNRQLNDRISSDEFPHLIEQVFSKMPREETAESSIFKQLHTNVTNKPITPNRKIALPTQ